MKTMVQAIGMAVVLGILSGCRTWTIDAEDEGPSAETMAIENLRMDMARMKEQLAALDVRFEQLEQQIGAARREGDSGVASQAARLDQLEKGLRTLEADRQRLREEIVNDISGKVATLVNSRASASSASGGGHVVEKGESLSQIASKYSVSVKALCAANGITDPNQVRVGQRLTIP